MDLVRGGVYHPFTLLESNRGIAYQPVIEHLLQLYQEGVIKPAIAPFLRCRKFAQAHDLVETRRSVGKVLLKA